MSKCRRYVGLDVHAETIAVAISERRGEARSLGIIPNRPEAVRKLLKKLGDKKTLSVCYEAGPTGYGLYWQLTKLGVECEVIAPSMIPKKSGDRVKTDRRDAEKLAKSHRAGELTPVWVPDKAHEALRDLVRHREAAKSDASSAKQRLLKFLLRHGQRHPGGSRSWTHPWWRWVQKLRFEYGAQNTTLEDLVAEVLRQEQRVERLEKAIDEAIVEAPLHMRAVIEALQSMRGIAKVTAVTFATEVGTFKRFPDPRSLMGYSGTVPSERSSGPRQRKGGITRTGNAHLRRVLTEAAHHYRHRPWLNNRLKKMHEKLPPEVVEIAWKAQVRLNRRHWALTSRGKPAGKAITAVGRELLGFIWAVGLYAEEHAEEIIAA